MFIRLSPRGRGENLSFGRVAALPAACIAALAALAFLLAASTASVADTRARHAIAMHGEPALPENFAHFPYADPGAPKGGRLTVGLLGTFDSLNPLVVKGVPAQSLRGYVMESLLARGYDEPFTLYGLLARSVETDAARSYVTFNLDERARFSDGTPVTPEDVIFSWQLLRDKGRPNYRTYYSKVTKAEKVGERGVRFDLSEANDRELPLILGLMAVLPRHAIDPDTFEDTSLTPMVASGPYVIKEVDVGKSVTLARNPNYWGRDLPVNRGFWNFDSVRFDYYRDANAYFEAFRKGLFDFNVETDPSRWKTAYGFPAARDGRVVKEEFKTGVPQGMRALVFNTRRPVFADIRVRKAINHLFDFEWVNRSLFYGLYQRTGSYFEGSELASRGRPADARERALLAPFPDAVTPKVLAGAWAPPASDGSGRDRVQLKAALDLFAEAGYAIDGTVLKERATGRPFTFEIMVTTRDQERIALAFASSLKRAGITPSIRMVDAVQFEQRRIAFDFDMIQYYWDESLSPGNEQAFYWGSAAADEQGSRNYMGVRSPAVDAMIAALLKAEKRDDFVSAVRALDRVLLSGEFVVPLFHLPAQWMARWKTIRHPAATSLYGYLPEVWWREPSVQN